MSDDIMTPEECAELRRACLAKIQQSIDLYIEERTWSEAFADWLSGSTPTVDKVLDEICCRRKAGGCDCEQVKQYIRDQDAVIRGLEAYIAGGNFTTFPTNTALATSGPLGIRPADASCCIRRIIDIMEEWFTSGADSPVVATVTLYQGIYQFVKAVGHVFLNLGLKLMKANPFQSYVIKKSLGVDITDINRARADIELGRSRAFREMLRQVYALCCCEG